jgi:hypothetical protein
MESCSVRPSDSGGPNEVGPFRDGQFAERTDDALDAGGYLVSAWEAEHKARRDAARIGKLLTASARDSLRLITPVEEQLDLSGLDGGVRDLAVAISVTRLDRCSWMAWRCERGIRRRPVLGGQRA